MKRYLAHLAHVELITTDLDASVEFFKSVLGLYETAREGQSVYLRCWGDHYHHSLILTPGPQPALGHASWRTAGEDELHDAVAQLEARGTKGTWVKTLGHGDAYRFKGFGGHVMEIFWEVERFKAARGQQSTFPERPQKFAPIGIGTRQLDHVTFATADPVKTAEWYRDTLGFRFMATTFLDHDPRRVVFAVVTTNEKSHDLGLGVDFSPIPGRLHHLAFWLDTHDELLRAADQLLEAGVAIEYGPGKHGIGEQSYLYFREPGGVRIELNTGGYRNYVPDWEPVHWPVSKGSNTMYRNHGMPDSMMEAFPPARERSVPDADLVPALADDENPWKVHG